MTGGQMCGAEGCHKDYWEKVVRVMKATTMKRALRAMPIMGRSADSEDVEVAHHAREALEQLRENALGGL